MAQDDDLVISEEFDGSPIPKDERVIPDTTETVRHDRAGNPVAVEGIEPFVWAQAHHNLPGFEQVDAFPQDDPDMPSRYWMQVGDCGWIPNNEEGVQAVELGFAKLVSAPEDAPPMPTAERIRERDRQRRVSRAGTPTR